MRFTYASIHHDAMINRGESDGVNGKGEWFGAGKGTGEGIIRGLTGRSAAVLAVCGIIRHRCIMPKATEFDAIEDVLKDLRAGKMVIVTDDEDRENEGDLVMAAEKITPAAVNFM